MLVTSQPPLWQRCLHFTAGTCPELMLAGPELSGECSPRPELSQDLALLALGQTCAACALRPGDEEP